MPVLILFLALWVPTASAHSAGVAGTATITGTVRDDTAAVLPGATIAIHSESGRVVALTTSDAEGRFRIDVPPGTYRVDIGLPNFGRRRYAGVYVAATQTRILDATLPLTLAADVTVTAKRTFRNLADRESAEGGLLHIADSASEGRVGGSLRLRHFGPRDLVENGSVRSRSTTLVNGQLVVPVARHTKVVLDAFNLFDVQVSDLDYFYTSRLRDEPAGGVSDVHSHPTLPRSVRIGLQIGF